MVKEIYHQLEKLDDKLTIIDKTETEHTVRLRNIDDHLCKLNSKVAKNVEKIDSNRKDIDTALVEISKFSGLYHGIKTDHDKEREEFIESIKRENEELRGKEKKFNTHVIWGIIVVLTFLLTELGFVKSDIIIDLIK